MGSSVFKPLALDQQTIVITGATQGIGLYTAKIAAHLGAKVVMSSGNRDELKRSSYRLLEQGLKVHTVLTDVTRMEDQSRLMNETLNCFGQIDTWINSESRSISDPILIPHLENEKELFDVNFWGCRIGSSIAIEAMGQRGGTLINIGSEVSVTTDPLHGIYSASKRSIKSFTNSLRVEVKDRKLPVEICLVRPTAELKVTAEAIIKCAVHPRRDVYVGGPARLSAILDTFFPGVIDIVSESKMKELRGVSGKMLRHYKRN